MKRTGLLLIILLTIILNFEAQILNNTDSIFMKDQTGSYFNITNFQRGDTVILGKRSSYHYFHNYKYIKQFKYRKLNHRVNKDLASGTFVIKRIGSERRFLHNRKGNKQDVFIRFGKKGLISRKDYIADLTGAIKSGEIITRPIDEYSDDVYSDTVNRLTFFYYIKSNNRKPDYYANEYHYYFMAHKFKIEGYWENNPEYNKLLKLAIKTINETLPLLDYNNTYSCFAAFKTCNYDYNKKGYYIEPIDTVLIPIRGYHDAQAIQLVFVNFKEFSFLSANKNFTHPFVKRKDPKRNYYKHRIYARINFRFLNKKDENLPGDCRSVYAEILSLEFFNYNDDISYWIGTINKK